MENVLFEEPITQLGSHQVMTLGMFIQFLVHDVEVFGSKILEILSFSVFK